MRNDVDAGCQVAFHEVVGDLAGFVDGTASGQNNSLVRHIKSCVGLETKMPALLSNSTPEGLASESPKL